LSERVLDASAVLASIFEERGNEVVRDCLAESYISAVNLAEVASKLADRGYSDESIGWMLRDYEANVVPFSATTAIESGRLRSTTRTAGLSLGDRACLALAVELGVPALTADRRWTHVRTKAKVELIR
jgi:PIN domain nuclease of toxin-antitoxin system